MAVIGASRDRRKVGRLVLDNILDNGFRGAVYPVNPVGRRLAGRPVHARVEDIGEAIDLAVVAVPARFVPGVIDDCARAGVRAAIIISAGFKEAGIEGAALEATVRERAAAGGMRILGPNCLGLIDTHSRLNATFARGMPRYGHMAFFSQSGALCQAIIDWALGEGIGFSRFISIGNKSDLDEVSMLEALAVDPHTRVILGYLESVRDGRGFIEAASRITPTKPIILTKSGTTQAGARAAASHTGALTGSETAFQAACERAGIIRARTVGELFNYALAFADQPIPAGPSVAVVTNAGGPGIMTADAIEHSGVRLATLGTGTLETLRHNLPPAAGIYNPVDLMGDARADRYAMALDAALADPGVDGALVLLTPQVTTDVEGTARAAVRAANRWKKPVIASFMGGASIREGEAILVRGHVPSYRYPEHAVGAFEAMVHYGRLRAVEPWAAAPVVADRTLAASLLEQYAREGRLQLAEAEARHILEAYRFPLVPSTLARTAQEAVDAADRLGYPVVVKVASDEILHKSDIGGVRLGLANAAELREAFGDVLRQAKKYFPLVIPAGVMVQPQVVGGREVILGATRDPVFGPIVMVGLGGIYVEVLKDVSYRLAPLSLQDARAMIQELRTAVILSGWRGSPPADTEAIADCLTRLSALMTDFPQILEAEINPLAVFPRGDGARAIDARLIIKEN